MAAAANDVSFYRYLPDFDVHWVDCGGRVDLETGLSRLKLLATELAKRPHSGAPRKLLIDFRKTVWDSEETHRELSRITRRDFLHADNPTLRAAIVNERWSGALSENEHWFFAAEDALAWLRGA